MMVVMTRWLEFVAVWMALAILLVFVCPLTFGPPAPQQKLLHIAALLACALAATAGFVGLLAATDAFEMARRVVPTESSRRLALICAFLC